MSDGYFLLLGNNEKPHAYSLANGASVPAQVTTSGSRSTLAIGWSAAGATNSATDASGGLSTYAVGSWTNGFVLPPSQAQALGLNVYAICDNDVWITNTDQSLVIDGTTGKTVRSTWSYIPQFGAPGWTVVRTKVGPSGGQGAEYLVLGQGPLVSLLDQVQFPSPGA